MLNDVANSLGLNVKLIDESDIAVVFACASSTVLGITSRLGARRFKALCGR